MPSSLGMAHGLALRAATVRGRQGTASTGGARQSPACGAHGSCRGCGVRPALWLVPDHLEEQERAEELWKKSPLSDLTSGQLEGFLAPG